MTRRDQPPSVPDQPLSMPGPAPGPDRHPWQEHHDPWQEYRAAAQSLDAVRRAAAAADAEATRFASAARAELAELSAQLARQQVRLTAEAERLGVPTPQLTPTGAERAAAEAEMAGDPAAIPAALPHCRELLAAVDAELAAGDRAAGRWRLLRRWSTRWWPGRRRRRTG